MIGNIAGRSLSKVAQFSAHRAAAQVAEGATINRLSSLAVLSSPHDANDKSSNAIAARGSDVDSSLQQPSNASNKTSVLNKVSEMEAKMDKSLARVNNLLNSVDTYSQGAAFIRGEK